MAGSNGSSKATRLRWARWRDDARVMRLRFRDLRLRVTDNPALGRSIDRLYGELAEAGVRRFRPPCWLSTEWFSPDGVPGIAIPFYLAHPRLMRLEERQMLAVEGGSEAQRMRILRHEAGHAVCTAYRLHRRKAWRQAFGAMTEPYPDVYRPRPGSRRYVTHLPFWYAQAHPAEDFAETFAVWLTPRSRWRKTYAGWPALRKLELVDALMDEVGAAPPPVTSRRRPEALGSLDRTLAEHYRSKRKRYGADLPDMGDADLHRLFAPGEARPDRPTAASFLRGIRSEVRDAVALWTGAPPYTIDQVLAECIERCRKHGLRLTGSRRVAQQHAMLMVASRTMTYLHAGVQPVVL
ncbi:MAG: putative zinc-binding metallopeptidase [Planctomycetota bacterium]